MVDKKNISWLTPDSFYDVDWPIIRELKKYYNIFWYVFRDKGSKREIPQNEDITKLIMIPYRFYDLRVVGKYNKIINEIKELNAMLIYTGYEGFPFFMPLLFFKVDSRITILAGHETNPWRRGARSWPLRVYLKYMMKYIGHVQVFSRFAEKEFYTMYPKKECSYVPMVPKDYGQAKEHLRFDGKKIFLFFGSIRPDKRLDVLLRAFTSMDGGYQDKAVLLVYGAVNHVEKEEIEKLTYGRKNIELHIGFVADKLVPTLFTSSNYLVLPYQQVSQSGPNMIAYNYNLPIIASDIKGFTERINDGETGYLFHVNDVESLRTVLESCIEQDYEDYNKIRVKMSNWVKQEYSLDSVVVRYRAMIDKLIAKNSKS